MENSLKALFVIFFFVCLFVCLFCLGTVYLDHAGATLFPQSQLTNFTKDLMENVYGEERYIH